MLGDYDNGMKYSSSDIQDMVKNTNNNVKKSKIEDAKKNSNKKEISKSQQTLGSFFKQK